MCIRDSGHDADEVFVSWGRETVRKFGEDELSAMLSKLDDGEYGICLLYTSASFRRHKSNNGTACCRRRIRA